MPIGIAGDSQTTDSGVSTSQLSLIEQRVISNLLQTLLGTNQAIDGLGDLRNDQAFQLQIPTPLPGAGR
jgi:hypothetical protein